MAIGPSGVLDGSLEAAEVNPPVLTEGGAFAIDARVEVTGLPGWFEDIVSKERRKVDGCGSSELP